MPPKRCCAAKEDADKARSRRSPEQRDIMHYLKKTLSLAVAVSVLGAAVPALAEDVKLGILGDLTGPIESLAPPIVAGAQLAFDHVNEQGGILDGGKIVSITG